MFRKIVDANPEIAHRLPGEVRSKYLVVRLVALLEQRPASGVRALGEDRRTRL